MKFTELLPQIQATYPEQPRSFHVLATRFYLGAETVETLQSEVMARRYLTLRQFQAIVRNR